MEIQTLRGDGVATVVVSGDVDAGDKSRVGEAVRALIAQGETRFLFDFAKVTYLGSSGVSCLVAARRDAVARSGAVAVLNPPPIIRKVFKTLGLEKEFPVFTTREEALRALMGPAR
jgi:anti-anti-sigma factor